MVIRLAENLKQSRLTASPTNVNSADHERLVGYPQSANQTRSGGTDTRAQETQQ